MSGAYAALHRRYLRLKFLPKEYFSCWVLHLSWTTSLFESPDTVWKQLESAMLAVQLQPPLKKIAHTENVSVYKDTSLPGDFWGVKIKTYERVDFFRCEWCRICFPDAKALEIETDNKILFHMFLMLFRFYLTWKKPAMSTVIGGRYHSCIGNKSRLNNQEIINSLSRSGLVGVFCLKKKPFKNLYLSLHQLRLIS